MKNTKSLLLIMLTFFFGMSFAQAQMVDLANSKVTWKGYKVTGSHDGTINIKEANLKMDNGKLIGGSIVMDMSSITVTDLSGGSKGKLEGHLKSDDFFGVSTYPTAKLEITNVVSRGTPGEYKVLGDLTIKGITKPIKFNVKTDGKMMMAEIKVDRSEYNVKYGSGSFFDNLGDKTIYDEFDLWAKIALK